MDVYELIQATTKSSNVDKIISVLSSLPDEKLKEIDEHRLFEVLKKVMCDYTIIVGGPEGDELAHCAATVPSLYILASKLNSVRLMALALRSIHSTDPSITTAFYQSLLTVNTTAKLVKQILNHTSKESALAYISQIAIPITVAPTVFLASKELVDRLYNNLIKPLIPKLRHSKPKPDSHNFIIPFDEIVLLYSFINNDFTTFIDFSTSIGHLIDIAIPTDKEPIVIKYPLGSLFISYALAQDLTEEQQDFLPIILSNADLTNATVPVIGGSFALNKTVPLRILINPISGYPTANEIVINSNRINKFVNVKRVIWKGEAVRILQLLPSFLVYIQEPNYDLLEQLYNIKIGTIQDRGTEITISLL